MLPGAKLTFKSIACGNFHSVALATDGRVYTWGSGGYGELGHGAISTSHPLCGSAVYLRGFLTGMIGSAGHKGKDEAAELKVLRPTAVPTLPAGCVGIACGSAQTTAVSASGDIWVCGSVENYAEAVAGDVSMTEVQIAAKATSQFIYTPSKIALPAKRLARAAACGKSHLVVLDDQGDVWAVGNGKSGQLGHGKRIDCQQPRAVLIGKKVVSVSLEPLSPD